LKKKVVFRSGGLFSKKDIFKNVQKPKRPFKMKTFFFEKVILLGDGVKTGGERKSL